MGTVVLAPPVPGDVAYDRDAVAGLLRDAGLQVLVPDPPGGDPAKPAPVGDRVTPPAGYVARLALAVTAAGITAPVLPVLVGSAGALAPAVALSQRAAHRPVTGYVLLDADCPQPGGDVGDWPDAPVAYLASPGAAAAALTQARLRDWRLVHLSGLEPEPVAAALAALVEPTR